VRVLTNAGGSVRPAAGRLNEFVEHHRQPEMSVGTYRVPATGADDQGPHAEDELYVVMAGRGRLAAGGETVAVVPGDVVFVPAGELHRFHDITEDLSLLVVFAPAYSGDAGDAGSPDPLPGGRRHGPQGPCRRYDSRVTGSPTTMSPGLSTVA